MADSDPVQEPTRHLFNHRRKNLITMATGGGTVNEGFQEGEQQEGEENTSPKGPVNDQAGPRWDCFEVRDESEVVISTSSTYGGWKIVHQVTKVLLAFFIAVVVLASAVIAKVSVFVLATLGDSMATGGGTTLRTVQVPWAWSLFACVVAPHVIALLVSLWRLLMRSADHVTSQTRNCPPVDLVVLMVTEGLQSLGVCVLFFAVLPEFHPPIGAILVLNTAIVPSLVSLATTGPPSQTSHAPFIARVLVAVVGCLLQLGSAAVFLYKLYFVLSTWAFACLAASLVLVSLGHWENYSGGIPALEAMRQRMMERRKRRVMYIVISLWKIVISFAAFIVLFGANSNIFCVRVLFGLSPGPEKFCPVWRETSLYNMLPPDATNCQPALPYILAALNVLLGVVCYTAGKAACKIGVSRLSLALPLVLSPLLSFGLLLLLFSSDRQSWLHACTLLWLEVSNMGAYFEAYTEALWLPVGVASYLSIIFVAFHVWRPLPRKQLKSQHLFFKPIYCDVLPDQSLLLNRTKQPERPVLNQDLGQPATAYSRMSVGGAPEAAVPLVYVCATMWHEEQKEMRQMMHSIFRLDADCWARKHLAKKDTDGVDYDVYDLQSHIFFDDAFDSPKSEEVNVNNYVRLLVEMVDATAKDKEFRTEVRPPTKIATPYGGRLVWTLPGGTTLTAHLKDKAKIRHRKRWSQVMYMYYFLGHELMEAEMVDEVMRVKADNTFLLALDGDVDFQPEALKLLLDRLKAEPNVGAACGRIHPIGQGPMVWYQKFEYAVSHWLQKSTEHVTGCVLCSPGCFSLFRGSALMAENVMARYTTPPTEARHYVQYDQGEDRWLCTLLLQQGYRVEYCAASDSFTFAPEGFYEFFNQRRRWTPSTMANILDLLQDWRHVRRTNPDISLPYILYQVLLLCSSVLTPGTIFLLVVGALSTAFPGLGLLGALLLNAVPVALFVLLCFLAKPNVQLGYAAVLSGLYSLLMMVVLVGLIRQAVMHGFCSVSTIFLLCIVGIFLVSALIHPQEFTCVLHGFLYFLTVPSTSMLLLIYSLGNLHVVSWGTRENNPPPSTSTEGAKKPPPKTWGQRLLTFFLGDLGAQDPKAQAVPAKQDKMEEGWGDENDLPPVRPHPLTKTLHSLPRPQNPAYQLGSDEEGEESDVPYERPSWLNDAKLGKGKEGVLVAKERDFWIQLIEKYLKPLDKDEKKQHVVQQELLALRNKVCLFFFLVNGLFIVLIVTWQALAESTPGLSINVPCRRADFRPETLEPISLAFMAVFGVLLAIQFLAMLAHRAGTLLHVLAATIIPLPCSREPTIKAEKEEMVAEMKRIQQGSVREADYEVPVGPGQAKPEVVDSRQLRRDNEWKRRTKRLQVDQTAPPRPPRPKNYMEKVQQYCEQYANESEIREALERSRGQSGGRAGKDLSKTVKRRATIVQRTREGDGGAQGSGGDNPPPVVPRPPRGPAKKRVQAKKSKRARPPPPPPTSPGFTASTLLSEDGDIYETLEMKEAEEEEENYQDASSSR